ncbi:Zn(II)2Cys6 transcription factor domain-containing protein [Aspergillus candidus]|uniref:Zn(2)-C6 fungal-type domain-containing protein n=1 Tax=Aspergillus candidus TaxID=41067 RepID=A0A2I2FG13_ASPCN|nr:hypothetical protein BDW47DRAFT_10367 [Aspergillus candidus]PLB39573.1 hypothetical protein BDW47DRAFT_10367 [Aspergillus candidus]
MAQQGSSRSFRPIAPRALAESPVPGPPIDEPNNKIKRASTACTECKRRRTKCSADTTGTPCTECALHNRECIIDEFADKRRKVAARRAHEDLKYYRGFLEQLLAAIRYGNLSTVDSIVDVIRSGASQEEIHATVSQFAGERLKEPDQLPASHPTRVDGDASSLTPDGI